MATPTARRERSLDVRPLMGQPGEPFRSITATVAALAAGETLVLIAPFLPSPIIEKLQAEGFEARPTRRTDGAWETRFQRIP
jgi:uncharacterized protein (DUF2249 family)